MSRSFVERCVKTNPWRGVGDTARSNSSSSQASSRRNSQSTPQPTRTRQPSVPFPTSGTIVPRVHEFMSSWLIQSCLDPEPTISFGSGEPISQWRREEILTLPQELRGQCLLTMQARKRQDTAVPEQPLATTSQGGYDTTATVQTSTVHSMFGSDINASCFGERERARQMQILMAMWSRRYAYQRSAPDRRG